MNARVYLTHAQLDALAGGEFIVVEGALFRKHASGSWEACSDDFEVLADSDNWPSWYLAEKGAQK